MPIFAAIWDGGSHTEQM